MNRMKWCGKEYDYFTYFGEKDFNGVIKQQINHFYQLMQVI